jgi:hypothetical protein
MARHPAGEVIALLGDQLGKAIVDQPRQLVDLVGCKDFQRRLRIRENLLIVRVPCRPSSSGDRYRTKPGASARACPCPCSRRRYPSSDRKMVSEKCVYASIRGMRALRLFAWRKAPGGWAFVSLWPWRCPSCRNSPDKAAAAQGLRLAGLSAFQAKSGGARLQP